MKTVKYRIVGLGTLSEDETCVFSKGKATGYVEKPDSHYSFVPADLKLFSAGPIGSYCEYLGNNKGE